MIVNSNLFRTFLAALLIDNVLSYTCYYYPNYPYSYTNIAVYCRYGCCSGYQLTASGACCSSILGGSSLAWYIYLVIGIASLIAVGLSLFIVIYTIIRRRKMRQLMLIYPNGQQMQANNMVNTQPYTLTTNRMYPNYNIGNNPMMASTFNNNQNSYFYQQPPPYYGANVMP